MIDAVAIADQDALPVLDQGRKGLFGAMGVNQIERDGLGGQGPQPLQGIVAIPGRLINVAHGGLPGEGGNGFVVGHDGLRNPVDHLLHGPQAHRNMQDGVAEVLDKTPRGPMHAGEFADEGRQARAIAGLMLGGDLGFEVLATPRTMALV